MRPPLHFIPVFGSFASPGALSAAYRLPMGSGSPHLQRHLALYFQ